MFALNPIQTIEKFDSKGSICRLKTIHRSKENKSKDNLQRSIALSPLAKNQFHSPQSPSKFRTKVQLDSINNEIIKDRLPSSVDSLPSKLGRPTYDAARQELMTEQRAKILELETHLSFLKTLISKEYDTDRLANITDILMRYFVKTPNMSSFGKLSSFYTDYDGPNSNQNAGSKLSSPFHIQSDEGNVYSFR